MLDRLVRRVYERLGRRYRLAFPVAQAPAVLVIAAVAVLLLTSYYDPSSDELLGDARGGVGLEHGRRCSWPSTSAGPTSSG